MGVKVRSVSPPKVNEYELTNIVSIEIKPKSSVVENNPKSIVVESLVESVVEINPKTESEL